MTEKEQIEFFVERNNTANFSIQLSCLVGSVSFLLFGFVDQLFVQGTDYLYSILFRFSCIVFLTFLSIFLHQNKSPKNNFLIAWFVFLFIGVNVNFATYHVGGIQSGYHQALILTIIAYSAFLPTTVFLLAILNVMLIACYNLAIFSVSNAFIPTELLVTNNAILVISSLSSFGIYWIQRTQLEKEFLIRGQLNNANAQLKLTSQSKDQFFANISHELRTPLTIIMASIESLAEVPDYSFDSKLTEQLQLCYRNSIRLLRLVDDVLELSKLEKGIFRLKLGKISIVSLLEGLIAQIIPLANRKKLSIISNLLSDQEFIILCDEWQIERVILNVFANAIKFTPEHGTITISIRMKNSGVLLTIQDTGVGIEPKDLPYVFEPFFQGNHTGDRKPGVGIGLALCKKIIGAHTGQLTVESELGRGTTLNIWLPEKFTLSSEEQERRQINLIVEDDKRQELGLQEWNNKIKKEQDSYRLFPIHDAAERRIVPRYNQDKNLPLVLMVDDNQDVLILVKSILNNTYRIYTAESAREGLLLAERHKPDVIVSDLMMPEMNGLDFFHELKKIPSLTQIPFILLTAKGQTEDRIIAGEVGVDAYLSKPFHPRELKSTIQSLLNKKLKQEEKSLDDRSKSLQIMAEGIAHDILNPVGFVQSSLTIVHSIAEQAVQSLPEDFADKHNFQQDLSKFYEAGTQGLLRIQEAIGQLRRFSKGNTYVDPVPIDVNQTVQNAISVVSGKFKIITKLLATQTVAFTPGELEQVILNLLINAIQASESHTSIRVSTENTPTVHFSDEIGEKSGVLITIEDEGKGIPNHMLPRIFDPYFTTKQMGTGLGLTVCRKIIKQHGGMLDISSHQDVGTTVKIWLASLS